MKKILIMLVIVVVVICVPVVLLTKHKADMAAENIEIIDSGFSANEDGDYTYAVVFKNNTDEYIKNADFEAEAFDENGETLKPLYEDAIYLRTEYVRPGETAACVAMFKHNDPDLFDGEMPFSVVPADVSFKVSSVTKFIKDDGKAANLKIVDYELTDEKDNRNGAISFKARVINEGDEDFVYDYHNGETNNYMCCTAVYKDADGKVIGGATLGCTGTDPSSEEPLVFRAGEETEVMFSGYCGYWPSETQDLYLTAFYYD